MKKLVLLVVLMLATITVKANNILYFTYHQAARTVACLNSHDELMIYCGYENELPTYVLINEVWAEQIGSSFYEVWLYGYDAYTGEEIYMPIDLECIYLLQNGKIYSAAQYLRFRTTHARPTFAWVMPPYNPFVRAPRPTVYYYTYHYDIHRPGWHWHHYPHIHYHPYYLRKPGMPAPIPPKPYTPGHEYPGYHVTDQGYQYDNLPLVGRVTAPRSAVAVQNNPVGRSGNRITSDRKSNTITTTDRVTGSRTTSNAPGRTESLSGRGTRDNNVSTRDNSSASRSEGNTTRTGSSTSRSDSGTSRGNTPSTSRSDNDRGSASNSGTATRDNGSSRNSSATSRTGSSTSRSNTPSTSRSDNDRGSASNSGTVTRDNGSSRNSSATSRTGSSTSSSQSRTSGSSRTQSSRGTATATQQSTRTSNNVSTPSRSGSTSSTRSEQTSTRGTATRTATGGRN